MVCPNNVTLSTPLPRFRPSLPGPSWRCGLSPCPLSPRAPLASLSASPRGPPAGVRRFCRLPPCHACLPHRVSLLHAARRGALPHSNPLHMVRTLASCALGARVPADAGCSVPEAGVRPMSGTPAPKRAPHACTRGAQPAASVLPAPGTPTESRACVCVQNDGRWWPPGACRGVRRLHMQPPPLTTALGWRGTWRAEGWGAGRLCRRFRLQQQHAGNGTTRPCAMGLPFPAREAPSAQGAGPGGWANPQPQRTLAPTLAHPGAACTPTTAIGAPRRAMPRHRRRTLCGYKCTCCGRRRH